MGVVRVRGHFRSDGSYVEPHYRTTPDRSRSNNWGSKGNINPSTGKRGRKDLFALPLPPRWRRRVW